jgi:hypothetical protein
MKMSQARHQTHVSLASLGLLSLAALGASACSKSEAATLHRGSSDTQAPVGATAVSASAKAETDNYVAEIKAAGSYAAGTEGTVEVVLAPKGAYHMNAQYPYKFKAADPAPDGVTFPKPVLQRADGNFEEKRGSFKVPFVASKSGTVTVSGTLSLSVCSDANCIMDKVALEIPVSVK